jgi:hypothetical protein
LGKHRGMFIDRSPFQWDDDPNQWTEAQLDAVADHLLRRALGTNDPQIIAEAGRQLEAGIDPSAVARHFGLVPTSTGIEPLPANRSAGTKIAKTTEVECG